LAAIASERYIPFKPEIGPGWPLPLKIDSKTTRLFSISWEISKRRDPHEADWRIVHMPALCALSEILSVLG
jgi:hypothetical protein